MIPRFDNADLEARIKRRAREMGRKRLRQRPPRQQPPDAAEAEYVRRLVGLIDRAYETARATVQPELRALVNEAGVAERGDAWRTDDWVERARSVFRRAERAVAAEVTMKAARSLAVGVGRDVSEHNREEVNRTIRAVVGVDVIGAEPELAERLAEFAERNADLIVNVRRESIERIEAEVMERVAAGDRVEEIEAAIAPDTPPHKYARNRARVVARDQVGKLNGQLTEARHRRAGIRKYRWRNVDDVRVRGNPGGLYPDSRYNHWSRDGKVFSYDDPPPDGNPGEPIQCRCWAEPVMDDLIEAAESEA